MGRLFDRFTSNNSQNSYFHSNNLSDRPSSAPILASRRNQNKNRIVGSYSASIIGGNTNRQFVRNSMKRRLADVKGSAQNDGASGVQNAQYRRVESAMSRDMTSRQIPSIGRSGGGGHHFTEPTARSRDRFR